MTYNITKTDGTQFREVEEGKTEATVYENGSNGQGIILIGKLVPEYGTDQSNNFIRLLENFANTEDKRPDSPVTGMLWFNKTEKSLNVCVDEDSRTWTKVLYIKGTKEINANEGDIYYDDVNKQFYIYDDEDGWILIGPINYKHKVNKNYFLTTYSGKRLDSTTVSFDGNTNTSYLVTMRVVAREMFSDDYATNNTVTTEYPNGRSPETASWICTFLVENYREITSNTQKTIIVGNPNYQVIAKSNGEALNWEVKPDIDDNNDLYVAVEGVGTDDTNITEENNHVDWEIEVEILKV